jgi:hypothetical protein
VIESQTFQFYQDENQDIIEMFKILILSASGQVKNEMQVSLEFEDH